MSISSRIRECCEGLTRGQIYAALSDVGRRTIDNALAEMLSLGRIHIKEWAPHAPGDQRRKGSYSSKPGHSVPYPVKPKKPTAPKKAKKAKPVNVEQPRLPIPASIFHFGSIITVDQRGWQAVNESFRRRA